MANENKTPTPLFDALESDATGQSVTANDVNSESSNSSAKQSQSREQGTYQPIITPNYTIGNGKPKRTADQTMIELKKRAEKQKQQLKLRKEKVILKKLDTILSDSEEEPETMNNPENDNRPDNERKEAHRKEI